MKLGIILPQFIAMNIIYFDIGIEHFALVILCLPPQNSKISKKTVFPPTD